MLFFSLEGNIKSSKGRWTEEGMWVCKSSVNLTYYIYLGSKKCNAGLSHLLPGHFTRATSWEGEHLIHSHLTYLYYIAGQPRTIRAVPQTVTGQCSHTSTMWGSSTQKEQATFLVNENTLSLPPKNLLWRNKLAVCFPGKWAINQLLQQCICIWIAHVQSQLICKYKRSRLCWNKAALTLQK